MTRARWLLLVALGAAALGLTALTWFPNRPRSVPNTTPRVVWAFEPPQRGGVVAGLTIDGDALFAAFVRDTGLGATCGAVYCLDRYTGRPNWEFSDSDAMLHSISTPLIHRARLFVGEGMHGDVVSKLYCLDARTGEKRWSRAFGGHIESGPVAADPNVLVTAGDDGLHAADGDSGKPRWSFRAAGHIDAAPAVHGERLYGGSGVSRQYRTSEVFCLDLATGKPSWRVPSPLPVWGSPVVDGGALFVAIGNGRLTSSEPPPGRPEGALLRLDPKSGATLWRAEAGDGVLARPAADSQRAYFVSRDGFVRAVDRNTGAPRWRRDLGSPLVAAPALVAERLYVASTEGLLVCLNADNGERIWTYDFGHYSSARPRLLSGPLPALGPDGRRWVYLGTELRGPAMAAAVVFCLEEPPSESS